MKNFAVGRTIGLLFLILAAWISIYFSYAAVKWNSDMKAARVAVPCSAEVDLSKPSQYTFPLHQTYLRAHSQSIYLQTDAVFESDEKAEEVFKDFKSKITLVNDKTGEKEWDKWNFPNQLRLIEDEGLHLFSANPFPKGDYTLKLQVLSGAPELAGKKQNLHCKYDLCGLEYSAILVFIAIAIISGIPAIITAWVITPSLLRYGFRVKPLTSSADPGTSPGLSEPSAPPPTPHTTGADSCTQNPGDTPRPDKTP